MPRRASTRLAIRPRWSTSMIGIPPPAEASNAMAVFFSRASLNSSGPRRASSALFAVTTGLPSFSARSTKVNETPVPPISSMITSDVGSSMAALASSDIGSSAWLGGYSWRFLTTTWRRTKSTRVRRLSNSCCFNRMFTTPPPTVPQPSRVTPISLLELPGVIHTSRRVTL